MIHLELGGCRVDILPVVNGLVSEAERVREAFQRGYEAYGISLGADAVYVLQNRAKASDDDFETGELDLAYAIHMNRFGEVQFPSPAMCEIVDLCTEGSKALIPLDMNDERFTDLYIKTVKATEYVKEHRLAKKGVKKAFDASTPEELAVQWDLYVNKVKGYARMCRYREEFIAEQILDIPRYKKSFLAVIEVERCKGIVDILERSA